ncbi:AarF/ABC1/UbiB kinase family protein [Paenibacillus sp. TRM 82003]|nr:AarF/ABC1/UbiB kinase family protein [Paenibacillus sp. TRM 82003]
MLTRIRHIQRYRDIAAAFSRNGFGFIVKDLGLLEFLSLPKRLFVEEQQDFPTQSLGERFRRFLEELGPTFVKIGQLASTRQDLLPPDMLRELEKLQDRVAPFPFEDVQAILKRELGGGAEHLFREFRETPLAAASIGQVHYAVLKSGERVAVKVQRPGMKQTIETDLEILQDLAVLAEHRLAWAARYQLREIVDEFAKALRSELNYVTEGRNAERIAKPFADDPNIRVPKLYWEYSTPRVLTMEYVEGVKLSDVSRLVQAGNRPKVLAERVVRAILHQILIEGFFHGDPHPGNILALPGDVIAFLDFGMVGRLSPETKGHFASMVIAMMRQSTDGVIRAITRMGLVPDDVNMTLLRSDVDGLREKYLGVPLGEISFGEAVSDLLAVAYQHRIQIPADLTLLGKTLLTIEGTVARLDPELKIIEIAEPFGRRLLMERYHPKKIAESFVQQLSEYGDLLTALPKHLQDVSAIMKQGKLRMEIAVPELELFLKKLDRIGNRLSFSVVLLAFSIVMVGLIIGSALGGESSILWRLPAIEIGFGVAFGMFVWLLHAIFKSGRF